MTPPLIATPRGRGRARARLATAALLAFALLLPFAAAQAQAPPDTTLDDYLRRMSDSTDAYFGRIAEPLDTTGLDSAAAYGRPVPPARERWELAWGPALDFNRVDAAVYGLGAAVTAPRPLGRLGGRLQWANGPDEWLGGLEYRNTLPIAGGWDLRAFGGRVTAPINRENEDRTLRKLRAFLNGSDRTHYLRHDGYSLTLSQGRARHLVSVRWRDALESPRSTLATWNLLDHEPSVPWNLEARYARAREITTELTAYVPGTPLLAEARFAHADEAYGSDLDQRRLRLAAGLDLPLGRFASLVTQAAWGRLTGDFSPQAAFYLGGPSTLRGVPRDAIGGAAMAIGRIDLLSTVNLLEKLGMPRAEAFPFSPGLFIETGAVWGRDPYGGPDGPGEAWPEDDGAWVQSAGFSLLYSSALLPSELLRFNWGWPIGPDEGGARFTITISRPLDLLRPLDRPE